MQSEFSEGQVAPWLRDPDSYWTAWNYRRAVLAYRPDRIEAAELSDFAALGGPYFNGRLCLSSSADSISQAVVATLIDELGVRETELAVRGWVANLGAPVFDTEGELLEALASGTCSVAIVSSDNVAAAAASNADVPYRLFDPETVVVEVEAMGVTRHARNPDGGRKLIEWLLEDDVRARHAAAVFAEPARMQAVDRKNVSRVALYREDAVKLAERARYR
jgi:iron(III) transport system substrate-binding protein